MILIIVGFVIGIFLSVFIGEEIGRKTGSLSGTISGLAIVFVGVVIFMAGLIAPIHGYEDPIVLEEYALEEIIEGTGIYVIQSNDGATVMCKHILSENAALMSQDKYFVYNEEVKIDTNEITKPSLKKMLKKSKKSPLTFALGRDVTEYVFYVPESGIMR